MGLQIRRSVFETNSSSTHSICVTKNNVLDQLQDKIVFTIGGFGWEWEIYYTPTEKASYLYTAILVEESNDLIDKIKSILDANNIKYEFETPKYSTGEYKYLEKGYVDHSNELGDFLTICDDEDKLMRYLFSSESFILTGNDNDDGDVDINVDYDHDEFYKGN